MAEPCRIFLPNSVVMGLVAGNAAGPIYMTSAAKDSSSGRTQTTLSAIDLSGQVLWRRFFAGLAPIPRATGAATGGATEGGSEGGGSVWLAQHGPDGAALEQIGRDGSSVRTIALACRPDEELGAMLIVPGGFCTAWTSGPPYRGARVDWRDADGACIWSSDIPPDRIAHDCVMETSAETGWLSRPKKPWTPGIFRLHYWEPLLISGDRILASYRDNRSGLGISYFLDTGTGQIINSTKPAPIGHKAIGGKGEFLIGVQGYDEFSTARYDRAGQQTTRWATHAAMLADRTGRLLGVELDGRTAARPRLRVMGRDGGLSDGPRLTGHHTTHPALDRDGTAVFWRDGKLATIDAEFTPRELLTAKDEHSFVSGRVLLLEDGIVAFNLSEELFLLRTALGPLEDSVWPCGDGNLNGNPVAFAE